MSSKNQKELARKAAIEAQRVRSILGAGLVKPIDPVQAAEACGCQIWYKSLGSLEGVYSPEPRPTIILGSERPAGRRAYSCGHELGHHVFGHGYKIEELESQTKSCAKHPDEYIADMFAGYLLMPQTAVRKALKDRGYSQNLSPFEAFKLASYFGVGYSTIVNHMAWTLRLIDTSHANELLKVKPKQIKTSYGVSTGSELVIADFLWCDRAVDLEVGDTLALPLGVKVEASGEVNFDKEVADNSMFNASKSGIARAYCDSRKWAVNIRISRKNYDGLAQYRFLSDEED